MQLTHLKGQDGIQSNLGKAQEVGQWETHEVQEDQMQGAAPELGLWYQHRLDMNRSREAR